MTLQCNACNYTFEAKSGRMPHKCPYCDREGTVEPVKKAQDLIDEVSPDE